MAVSQTLQIIIEAVDNASDVGQGVADKFKSVGAELVTSGAALGLAVAPAVGVFGDAARQAVAFNESMTNAQAVLGLTSQDMVGLSDQILDMGQTAREGPQAVADSYYDIVSGVSDASTHMAILQAAINTSEAGASELGGTTAALVSIMNSYGYAASDAAMVSDALTNTVGMGVLTMDELAAAIPSVSGLASSLDVDFSELSGSMAFLTTKGFSASQAATQLQASMVAMLNPNETLKAAFDELGVASGEALVQQYGLVDALSMVADSQTVADEGLAKTLGSTEALNAALALTGDGSEEFLDTFKDSMDGATDAAQQIQLGSAAAQMDLLKSQVDTLRISVGSALLPVINHLVGAVRPVIEAVTDWARANPEVVQTVGMVVAGIAGLAGALVGVGGIISTVGVAIGFLVSPIGLVVAALAGLAVAYQTNFGGMKDTVNDAVGVFRNFAGDVIDAFNTDGIEGVGREIWDAVKSGFPVVVDWIWDNIASPIGSAIAGVDWAAALEVAGDVLSTIMNAIVTGATVIGDWVWDNILTPIGSAIGSAPWGEILTDAANIVSGILTAAAGLAVDFEQWIRLNLVYPLVAKIQETDWTGVISGIGGFLGDILDAAAGVVEDFGVWIYDNLVSPVITALGLQDWKPEFGAENSVIGAILEAVAGVVEDFGGWIKTNIAEPVISALADVDWGSVLTTIGGNAVKVIALIFGAIALESFNFGAWVAETLIDPVVDAIVDTNWIEELADVGQAIIDGIQAGLPDVGAWAKEHITGPITSAANSVLGFFGIGGDDGGESRDSGGPGIANTAYLIGTGAQPELFVPKTNGTFYPAGSYGTAVATPVEASGSNLGSRGGGGTTIVVPFVYQPLISTATEREAEYNLRPIFERFLTEKGISTT